MPKTRFSPRKSPFEINHCRNMQALATEQAASLSYALKFSTGSKGEVCLQNTGKNDLHLGS